MSRPVALISARSRIGMAVRRALPNQISAPLLHSGARCSTPIHRLFRPGQRGLSVHRAVSTSWNRRTDREKEQASRGRTCGRGHSARRSTNWFSADQRASGDPRNRLCRTAARRRSVSDRVFGRCYGWRDEPGCGTGVHRVFRIARWHERNVEARPRSDIGPLTLHAVSPATLSAAFSRGRCTAIDRTERKGDDHETRSSGPSSLAHRYLVAASIATAFLQIVPAQVPLQDQQPAGSALRPAVMGPSGGVSTGHPLTTAAAFGILLKGGNAFDAGVAALLAGGVLEQDLYSLGGEALVLVYPKKDAKVTSIVGQGWAPHAVDVDWYLSRQKNLQGEGLDPAVVPGRAACRAHGARAMGHDELRRRGGSGDRLRGARLSDAVEHGTRDSEPARVLRALAGEQDLLAQARRIALQGRRDHQAAGDRQNAAPHGRGRTRARKRADAPPASSRRAIASTRATSPARWWRSCASTTRRSTKVTSPTTSLASRSRRGRPTAATPSTSTDSAVRVPCCCRRSTSWSSSICTRWATRAPTTSTRLSRR